MMPQTNKSKIIAIFSVLAGLGALLFAWNWWTVGRFIESTDNAYIEANMSLIAPKITGYVVEVPVVHNQAVRKGDILVRVDDRDYRARYDAAAANVAARRAAAIALTEQVKLQDSLIAEANARLQGAEAERVRSKADLDRYMQLATEGTVSRQRRDQAQADHAKAVASITASKASAAAERQRLTVFSSQIDEAKAAFQAAEADLKLAEIDLENTVIRAPIDGVVGNKQVELGQYLRPGQQILAVVPLRDVHVVANFKETQVAQMKIGQPVKLKIDAFKGQAVTGEIESFSPASGSRFSLLPPENATGNFTKIVQRVPVRIRVTSQDLVGALRPGLSVTVEVDTRTKGDETTKDGQGLAAATEPSQTAGKPAPTQHSAP